MTKNNVEPSDSSSNDTSNQSSTPNDNDPMNASSLTTLPQTDNQESNDLLKAILGTMQSIDKNVKKLRKIKSKSSLNLSVEHDSDPLKNELTTTPEQQQSLLQVADQQDREQYTAEYQLGDSLKAWVDLLSLIEEDNELCQLVLFRTEDTSSDDAQTQAGNEQAIKLVTMIACLAQWDKVTAIWHMLAERSKHYQRPATVDELHILSSAVDIHNLTWRDRKAKLQYVDYPTTYNYKHHQRGNMTGETITDEWLPALINAGATFTLNAIVYTE